jgi:hypothetical protein
MKKQPIKGDLPDDMAERIKARLREAGIEGSIVMGSIIMGGKGTTVAAHYGMQEQEYDKLERAMLCSLIMGDYIAQTLDKFFPELKDRAKVHAYANACRRFWKMQGKD